MLICIYGRRVLGALTCDQVFFVLLLVGSEALFVPASIRLLSQAFPVRLLGMATLLLLYPGLTIPPYIFLYLSWATSSSITSSNQQTAMSIYPFDHTIFHPSPSSINPSCRTCRRPKPARSKHCSICGVCVQKADHHCVWINNCVGRNNYVYFLSLILSISLLLCYGSWLGLSIMRSQLKEYSTGDAGSTDNQPLLTLSQRACFCTKMQTFLPNASIHGAGAPICSWKSYMAAWRNIVSLHPAIGAPTLLAIFCFPLAAGFVVYHVYLIWAGMTTNESSKWAELREDIADGLVWRRRMQNDSGQSYHDECKKNVQGSPRDGNEIVTQHEGDFPRESNWPLSRSPWLVVRMATPNVQPPPMSSLLSTATPPPNHQRTVPSPEQIRNAKAEKIENEESRRADTTFNTSSTATIAPTTPVTTTTTTYYYHYHPAKTITDGADCVVVKSKNNDNDNDNDHDHGRDVRERDHQEERRSDHEKKHHDDDDDDDDAASWTLVRSLSELENIYDLGFYDNLWDVVLNRD